MAAYTSTISVNTTVRLKLTGLRDSNGVYQNVAIVQMLSLTPRGSSTNVTGISFPLDIPYVESSNGDYEVEIPANVSFQAGRVYKALIKAVNYQGIEKEWTEIIKVVRAAI